MNEIISPEVRTKVLDIMQLAMLINDSPTEQELTGSKPTVFVDFSGHIAALGVYYVPEGWHKDITEDECRFFHFNLTGNEGVEEKLDQLIGELAAIFGNLEGGE